ncbi:MAG: transcription antitermination factor NusB [Oscillospiraceae bacterium]|jgi:N utilization substance protein B|nr:transcription antitermination factor NusB [Oscillospiraceae bacterium]
MTEHVTRRAAREQAFALLFALSFHPEADAAALLDWEREAGSPEPDAFARAVFVRAAEHQAELDETISRYLSKNWRLARISRVSLALLRLAVCEITCFPEVPAAVSINEAVELAKRYGDEETPRFVNGILGSVARAENDAAEERQA